MKPIAKILFWFLIGGGFGFFIGERVGERRGRGPAVKKREYDEYEDEQQPQYTVEDAREAMRQYTGDFGTVEGISKVLGQSASDEDDPEMPMEEPVMPDGFEEELSNSVDGDIRQYHPTLMQPQIVTEESYYRNSWELDQEQLLYYAVDKVLYNVTTQSIIEDPDSIIGIGTLEEFDPNSNVHRDTLFVVNGNFARYRIDYIDDAFCDAVDGNCAPEDDPPEEDEKEDDNFWDDV